MLDALIPGRDRPVVMGVLNVTSDSFSDGGRYLDPAAAVAHALELRDAGADLIDVGGESTRPGAVRIDPDTERARVLPVIRELSKAGVVVSVDTMRAEVAAAAVEAGAAVINDVSGGRADPTMATVVADLAVPWILMHWRSSEQYVHRDDYVGDSAPGHKTRADEIYVYSDVVADVSSELLRQVDRAVSAGVAPDALVLDPGLGFAKTATHNWQLLRALPRLVDLGFPLLIGASRKRFLGALLSDTAGDPRPPRGRDVATATISALAARDGVWGVRVHDVRATVDALATVARWDAQPVDAAARDEVLRG